MQSDLFSNNITTANGRSGIFLYSGSVAGPTILQAIVSGNNTYGNVAYGIDIDGTSGAGSLADTVITGNTSINNVTANIGIGPVGGTTVVTGTVAAGNKVAGAGADSSFRLEANTPLKFVGLNGKILSAPGPAQPLTSPLIAL